MIVIMHIVAHQAGHLDIIVDGKRITFVSPPISFTGNHWPEYGIYAFGCSAAVYAAVTYANAFRRAVEDGLRVLWTKRQEEPTSPPHAHEWVVSRHEVTVAYRDTKRPPTLVRKPILLLSYVFLHIALCAFLLQALCPAQKDSLQLLGSQCREAVNYKAGAPLLFPNQGSTLPAPHSPYLADLPSETETETNEREDVVRRLDVIESVLGSTDHAPPDILLRENDDEEMYDRERSTFKEREVSGDTRRLPRIPRQDDSFGPPRQIEDRIGASGRLPMRFEDWPELLPDELPYRVESGNDLPEQIIDRVQAPDDMDPHHYRDPLDAVSRRPAQIEDRVDYSDKDWRPQGPKHKHHNDRSPAKVEEDVLRLPTRDLQSDTARHWINRFAVLDPSRGIRHNPINIEVSPELIYCPEVTQIKATLPTMIHAAGAISFFSSIYISMNLLTLYLIVEKIRLLYRGRSDPMKCRELSFYEFQPSVTSIILKLLLAVLPLFRPLELIRNDILRHVSLIDYAGLNQRLAVGCVMLFIITLGLEIEGVKVSFFNATN